MKYFLLFGLWLSVGSFVCSNKNMNSMKGILSAVSDLVEEKIITKQTVESSLGITLSEDKKESKTQGMLIYKISSFLDEYENVELRLFNGSKNFFILIYPEDPIAFSLGDLKKQYSYKGFTAGDPRRQTPAGYQFEKNGKNINFYCDEKQKSIIQISVAGQND